MPPQPVTGMAPMRRLLNRTFLAWRMHRGDEWALAALGDRLLAYIGKDAAPIRERACMAERGRPSRSAAAPEVTQGIPEPYGPLRGAARSGKAWPMRPEGAYHGLFHRRSPEPCADDEPL